MMLRYRIIRLLLLQQQQQPRCWFTSSTSASLSQHVEEDYASSSLNVSWMYPPQKEQHRAVECNMDYFYMTEQQQHHHGLSSSSSSSRTSSSRANSLMDELQLRTYNDIRMHVESLYGSKSASKDNIRKHLVQVIHGLPYIAWRGDKASFNRLLNAYHDGASFVYSSPPNRCEVMKAIQWMGNHKAITSGSSLMGQLMDASMKSGCASCIPELIENAKLNSLTAVPVLVKAVVRYLTFYTDEGARGPDHAYDFVRAITSRGGTRYHLKPPINWGETLCGVADVLVAACRPDLLWSIVALMAEMRCDRNSLNWMKSIVVKGYSMVGDFPAAALCLKILVDNDSSKLVSSSIFRRVQQGFLELHDVASYDVVTQLLETSRASMDPVFFTSSEETSWPLKLWRVSKSGDIDLVWEELALLRKNSGLVPTLRTWGALAKICCRSNCASEEAIEKLLEELWCEGVNGITEFSQDLLAFYIGESSYEKVKNVATTLAQSPNASPKPAFYTELVALLHKQHDYSPRVWNILDTMVSSGISPDVRLYIRIGAREPYVSLDRVLLHHRRFGRPPLPGENRFSDVIMRRLFQNRHDSAPPGLIEAIVGRGDCWNDLIKPSLPPVSRLPWCRILSKLIDDGFIRNSAQDEMSIPASRRTFTAMGPPLEAWAHRLEVATLIHTLSMEDAGRVTSKNAFPVLWALAELGNVDLAASIERSHFARGNVSPSPNYLSSRLESQWFLNPTILGRKGRGLLLAARIRSALDSDNDFSEKYIEVWDCVCSSLIDDAAIFDGGEEEKAMSPLPSLLAFTMAILTAEGHVAQSQKLLRGVIVAHANRAKSAFNGDRSRHSYQLAVIRCLESVRTGLKELTPSGLPHALGFNFTVSVLREFLQPDIRGHFSYSGRLHQAFWNMICQPLRVSGEWTDDNRAVLSHLLPFATESKNITKSSRTT